VPTNRSEKVNEQTALEQDLRAAIEASHLSLHDLERLCGVSHATLSEFTRATRSIQLSTAGRLCEVLGMHLVKREKLKLK
jgi:transcriptional regulator with XRE-family HTH domain